MKTLTLTLGLSVLLLSGCNNASQTEQKAESKETNQPNTSNKEESTGTNPVSIKPIIDSYLQIKNGLVKDDDKAAATAGKDLANAIESFDKTALTPEQTKTYTEIEEDAREHAEHISKNVGNLKHQREHFETLSQDLYDLVKTFGAGQQLYYDHCPMYNNNKGAAWISETKEIQNPYLGKEMLTCGVVKEELK